MNGRPLLLPLAMALLSGCGREPEPVERTASPILDGADDPTDEAVVAIDTMLPTGEELCTGYLIMPDLVLTARHCVAPVVNPAGGCSASDPASGAQGGTPIAASGLLVARDAVLSAATQWLAVAEVTVLPDSEGAQLCGRDLAVLRLVAPIDGVAPIPLAIAAPPTVGEGFTAIGYGVVSPTQGASSDRRRSRGDLSVESVGASARTVDEEWIADTGPCAGDSGSPALDATGAAFGVMSRGPKATCKSMIYERVDPHAAFLVDQAKQSATRLGTPLPGWAGGAGGAGGGGGATASSSTTSGGATSDDGGGCSVGASSDGGGVGLVAACAVVLGAARRRRAQPSSRRDIESSVRGAGSRNASSSVANTRNPSDV